MVLGRLLTIFVRWAGSRLDARLSSMPSLRCSPSLSRAGGFHLYFFERFGGTARAVVFRCLPFFFIVALTNSGFEGLQPPIVVVVSIPSHRLPFSSKNIPQLCFLQNSVQLRSPELLFSASPPFFPWHKPFKKFGDESKNPSIELCITRVHSPHNTVPRRE